MARAKWCGAEIYAAGAALKQRCLIEDDSLFAPGSGVWTPAHMNAVAERAGIGSAAGGSFTEKLATQLEGLRPEELQLAAELLFVLLLPESDTSGAKKREHIGRILELLPTAIALPRELDAALDAGGVAAFAAGKAHRDAGLRFLARLFARVKERPRQERRVLLGDPWALRALVGEERTSSDALQANAFLHLLFPEQFEYMVSETHRQKLLAAFRAAPGVAEAENADRGIARIRELASAGGDPDLDLYAEPFHRIWSEEPPQRWAEAVDWARRLYAREDFDASERDYKLAIAAGVAAARDALLAGEHDWLERLRAAFTGRSNNLTSWRAHDAFLAWCGEHWAMANELLRRLWAAKDPALGLHEFLLRLPREAARGPGTRVSLASFLLLGVDPARYPFFKVRVHVAFRRLLRLGDDDAPMEIDPETVYRPNDLAARLGLDGSRVRDFLREAYPRAADEHGGAWNLTAEQAQRVVDAFADEVDPSADDASYAEWTALLEELRLRMLAAGAPLRDLLDAQSIAWWLVAGPVPEDWDAADRAAFEAFRTSDARVPATAAAEQPAARSDAPADVALPPATPALAARLHLPQAWLDLVLSLLEEKKQLILYGPPGTGKTFVARHIGDHIAEHDGVARLVQFHPSYTYEDFFEGYRPLRHDGGALSFELVPGALRELAREAEQRPETPHLLIVDEINRGNLSKIFGELYFLLEYRDASIRLQYSRDEDFRLPANLFLIGTMNTADRSIALVDSALRRRFHFVGLLPTREPVSRVLSEWLAANGLSPEPATLLDELNRAIDDEELAVGPSYFITRDATAPDLERTWAHAVLPLLEERCYGTGRDVEAEFGLAAIRRRVAVAADAPSGDSDAA